MAQWKFCRQTYGTEEHIYEEGDQVTIGRGLDNRLPLCSIVISRNHCVINVKKDIIILTDLKSSNGTYVGLKKIPCNVPYEIQHGDVIGLGWTFGAPIADIKDNEKFIFKVINVKYEKSLADRIRYQSENELDDLELEVANVTNDLINSSSLSTYESNSKLKRKIDLNSKNTSKKKVEDNYKNNPIASTSNDDVITISDSETQNSDCDENTVKKIKLEPTHDNIVIKKEAVNNKNDDFECNPFNIKQEYFGYDDEPIEIDSDSDSESEQWLLKLSQSSPGKPFIKAIQQKKKEIKQEDCSYSQIDDDSIISGLLNNEEEFTDDLISIPHQPPVIEQRSLQDNLSNDINEGNIARESLPKNKEQGKTNEISTNNLMNSAPLKAPLVPSQTVKENNDNSVISSVFVIQDTDKVSYSLPMQRTLPETSKKVQMIEPLTQLTRRKSNNFEIKQKSSSHKSVKTKKHSSTKKHLSNSQKEERNKRLKEIAVKEKEEITKLDKNSTKNAKKSTVNAKVTNTNRGAFLTDALRADITLKKRKENPQDTLQEKEKVYGSSSGENNHEIKYAESCKEDKSEKYELLHLHETSKSNKHKNKNSIEPPLSSSADDVENKHKHRDKFKKHRTSRNKSNKNKSESISEKSKSESNSNKNKSGSTSSKPLLDMDVSIRPLLRSLEKEKKIHSEKPLSKVKPLVPEIPKKIVRFSEAPPLVHIFEIEEGNKMKKTSLVKTTLVDVQQMPVFSLEKITLMKILRWNPQWLNEQINNKDPPPILGHNNPPMTIFHCFQNHNQYVQLVGDLLLMEIWEYLTQGYMRASEQRNQNGIQMRIESLPPAPSQDRWFELFNISVNISVPKSEKINIPRVGEIMLINFGPEQARTSRLFYVHNIRCLPSPPNNIYSFLSVSLHATYTEKMKSLRPGEVIIGKSLAYIHNELMLFEAMEYLAGSPLSQAILNPEPRHFPKIQSNTAHAISKWTTTLNESQRVAVMSSVTAALSDRPSIQMVQGPPGTGKSSVICAIVMSYFYDSAGRRHQNRGKILICATSNAAVDELVIRLLNIRQSLPKAERFRMVRVGRAEAMHPRARDVSSQQLAQRDAARLLDQARPAVHEEISHLEAKINMWKTQAQDAKDPVRVAYCENRVSQLVSKLTVLRVGGGAGGAEELRPEQVAEAEQRIVRGADIVVTTLASAAGHKMRGLKSRIALCIVDEAGQAIEPEALIPLKLNVTKLTLIGDPQQLPGFICSQRAKKHGLNESLFARLTSCTEGWVEGNPIVLLNQQYRMHPEIADYPNRAFYGGKILNAAPIIPDLNILPYSIVVISSGDKGQDMSGANELEARGVARLAAALAAAARAHRASIAVLTPYNAHKELIKSNLRLLQDPAEPAVEVATVDSFQGQERDIVVASLARSHGVGFLADAGRTNVLLTRARRALLVCLNPHALLKNHQWRTLVEDAQRRKLYRVLPNKMCQPLSPGENVDEDILKYIMK